ncbi:DUF2288 domain-containing protein [Thiohalophilus thiocyanatoxydans]|uniref:DUF2288 domain-containing protein n=1 Tax=Thiohalophilus thiocyanatoxydans TaxID=381308 RepID=A0A4R8IQI3_9GAMM|nr:DUF2288 domain-containing protein [Thiohalophilus thiocyanatoxydans]TDY02564.1 hypothetical protein EDC23_0939 [Thiohalophilus thiocyanatoxydans]
MSDEPVELNAAELRQKLNLETGQLPWSELQRHFARGVVVVADSQLDLIEVAAAFAEDDKTRIEQWIQHKQLARANDEHALNWSEQQPDFWSVVVAPWVIVQEITRH